MLIFSNLGIRTYGKGFLEIKYHERKIKSFNDHRGYGRFRYLNFYLKHHKIYAKIGRFYVTSRQFLLLIRSSGVSYICRVLWRCRLVQKKVPFAAAPLPNYSRNRLWGEGWGKEGVVVCSIRSTYLKGYCQD